MTPESFDTWLYRLRARDEGAARHLSQGFACRLVGLARLCLDSRLRGKIDPEDVVQSVFRTVWVRLGQGKSDLLDWDSLWGLLVRITVRKCGKWREHYSAACRDVRREQALSSETEGLDTGPIARDPDRAEADLLHDTLQALIVNLTGLEKQITLLRLIDGLRPVEIARRLGCSQSKVSRVLGFVRERLVRIAGVSSSTESCPS